MIEWCTHHMPRWHPISISGYHIREAGATAQQELAFTLKDGLTYVEQAIARGLRRRRVRAATVVLLQRPDRLLRGDRQVPRRAAHLGARAARDLRRPQRALVADALSLPDRRRLADRPAAAEQHRAHHRRGARRRARRHPVAAHQLLRRGARAADRGGRHDRAAHPAGDRARDRRRRHRRPARRLLLRRGAHRRDGAPLLRVLRQDRRARRDGARRSSATSPSARSPTPRSSSSARSTPASASWSASTATCCRTRSRSPRCAWTPPWNASRLDRLQAARARRDGAEVERTLAALREHAAHPDRNLMHPLLDCARAHASEGEIVESLQQVFGGLPRDPRLLRDFTSSYASWRMRLTSSCRDVRSPGDRPSPATCPGHEHTHRRLRKP